MKKNSTVVLILCSTLGFSQKANQSNTEAKDKIISQLKTENQKIKDSLKVIEKSLKTEYVNEKADSISLTSATQKFSTFYNLKLYSQTDKINTIRKDSINKKRDFSKMPRGF